MGLEAVVRAEHLQREPSGDDLGDRGRNERLVGVLRHEFLAIGIHNQHQRRRRQRRDLLLDVGEGLSGQQEPGKEQKRFPTSACDGIPAIPAISGSPQERTFALARVHAYTPLRTRNYSLIEASGLQVREVALIDKASGLYVAA